MPNSLLLAFWQKISSLMLQMIFSNFCCAIVTIPWPISSIMLATSGDEKHWGQRMKQVRQILANSRAKGENFWQRFNANQEAFCYS
jgi:hypothetical protein